jgi:DNA-binding NarL/FixJ family response regulator
MLVRIAIVDDDAPYRGAVAELLSLESSFATVDVYADPRELMEASASSPRPPWDVVLMDIELPGSDGIEATAELKARFPKLLVVMLTAFEDPERIVRAIRAGADGYLVKRSGGGELVEEIRTVVAGGSPLTPSVARSVLSTLRAGAAATPEADGLARFGLSARETEVLCELVAGKGYKEIGYDLHISVDTVRSHIRKIYGKLQVHSASAAVARAIRERIV